MSEVLHTKWGDAKINNNGYYVITSSKEGNHNKFLHRLIFEDFYGPIPEGGHIHHKDGNKLNNCIMNLQLLTEKQHNSLHKKGEDHHMWQKHHSEESRKKISESNSKAQNTSGYYRVSKKKDSCCKQGFYWRYRYYEDGKPKEIISVSLDKLEEKVKAKGLKWFKIEKKVG